MSLSLLLFSILCLLCKTCESVSTEEPQGPPQTEETTDLLFLYQCIDQSNNYRRRNGNENMVNFNRELTDFASRRATKLALTGKSLPSQLLDEQGIQENAAVISSTDSSVNCRPVIDAWYQKSFPNATKIGTESLTMKVKTSNQPLLVWERSTEIGCSRVTSSPEGSVIVCLYRNPNKKQ